MNNGFFLTDTNHQLIADQLVQNGYIVFTVDMPLSRELYQHVTVLPTSSFKSAGIGRKQHLQTNQAIRNDQIRWLSNDIPSENKYLMLMEECRQQLNQRLFLGLHRYEAHFSHYSVGSYYLCHFDAFKGQSNRIISTVFYLNPDWTENDGGALVIYDTSKKNELCKVLPQLGTLVFFLSEQLPHEVIMTHRDRYSIAGWFRIDHQLLVGPI